MNRLKEQWEKITTTEQRHTVALDVARATLLQEELEEETLEGKLTEKELAQATEISTTYINNLLRYHRFLTFVSSVKSSIEDHPIHEGRFRQYWQQMR